LKSLSKSSQPRNYALITTDSKTHLKQFVKTSLVSKRHRIHSTNWSKTKISISSRHQETVPSF